ncbi:hypothetical protein FKP32DRAFT_1665671 [Trametes sanguinea]|nr:hypothetical protein FKP32DRAFT_1665671 [Trametes sanguinea]
MSAATIADPFLLSSYPESAAHRKHSAVPVYASLPSTSDADPFVTVAVQGDGVHVLDTSTLHSAVSHTLGPSTSFSCSPASRTTQRNGGRSCTTYAVLDSGPDVQPEGKGKTVVAWDEPLAGGVADAHGEKSKRVTVVPHPASHIYAPDYLEDTEVIVGPAGEVSVADEELRVQDTFTPQNQQATTLVKHFLFQSSACPFLSPHTASTHSAVSVSFLRSGDVLRVSVLGVTEEGKLDSLGECAVPVEETVRAQSPSTRPVQDLPGRTQDIVDISCSNSGFISVLSHSGTWHALSLTTSPSSTLSISATAEPLRLQSLTFTSPTRAAEASLCALTSSHVLLAAICTGSSTEIALLLWDLRYGVLLAQQMIPVPSTLPRPKKTGAILRLSTSAPSPSSRAGKTAVAQLNALLVLAPAPDRDAQADSAPARSTLLVVPLTVPANSTIAAAVGRANSGARWLSTKQAPGAPQVGRGTGEMSLAARKALKEMKASVSGSAGGNVAGAESAFFEYVKTESRGKGEGAPLEYTFVQGVLEVVLPAAGAQSSGPAAYSAKIVRHLLERRAVSSSMVEGGLLPALAAQNDWENISLAMHNVSDLPEADVISLLSKVVAAHRRDDNAMQVLTFLQTLLDASFLALLAHAPAHALLRGLSAHLEPALALTSALEHLSAPLEPFARAAARSRASAEKAEKANVAVGGESGRDWRRKRKMAHEQAAVAVGLYQVEELVL